MQTKTDLILQIYLGFVICIFDQLEVTVTTEFKDPMAKSTNLFAQQWKLDEYVIPTRDIMSLSPAGRLITYPAESMVKDGFSREDYRNSNILTMLIGKTSTPYASRLGCSILEPLRAALRVTRTWLRSLRCRFPVDSGNILCS
jgi:hypothetical protein